MDFLGLGWHKMPSCPNIQLLLCNCAQPISMSEGLIIGVPGLTFALPSSYLLPDGFLGPWLTQNDILSKYPTLTLQLCLHYFYVWGIDHRSAWAKLLPCLLLTCAAWWISWALVDTKWHHAQMSHHYRMTEWAVMPLWINNLDYVQKRYFILLYFILIKLWTKAITWIKTA